MREHSHIQQLSTAPCTVLLNMCFPSPPLLALVPGQRSISRSCWELRWPKPGSGGEGGGGGGVCDVLLGTVLLRGAGPWSVGTREPREVRMRTSGNSAVEC